MRTGVYGGAFNPIHNGHLHILRAYMEALSLERVLLIPTGTSPHKPAPTDAASAQQRLEMCRLACEGWERVQVDDRELRRAGKSYTADTLDELHALYPQDELFLLMGEDMFLTVDRWYDAKRIARLAVLCGAPRSEDAQARMRAQTDRLRGLFPDVRVQIVPIPFIDVSSTQVRAAVRAGLPLQHLVPNGVAEYIRAQGLYREEASHGPA